MSGPAQEMLYRKEQNQGVVMVIPRNTSGMYFPQTNTPTRQLDRNISAPPAAVPQQALHRRPLNSPAPRPSRPQATKQSQTRLVQSMAIPWPTMQSKPPQANPARKPQPGPQRTAKNTRGRMAMVMEPPSGSRYRRSIPRMTARAAMTAASQRAFVFADSLDIVLPPLQRREVPCGQRQKNVVCPQGAGIRQDIPIVIAFLRRHYPDQVRGTGRQCVSSQPACASAPWIMRAVYHLGI